MKLTPTFTGIVGALALTVMPIASASTVRLTLRAKEIAAGYKAIFLCCDTLCTRILLWTEEEIRLNRLPPKSGAILEAMLYRGELPRGDAAGIVGTGDRQARRVVSVLVERGVVVSMSSRAPLRLAFPAALASRWMPGLFPDQPR